MTNARLRCMISNVSGRHNRHNNLCASGSVGGARPCQGRGRGFESRLALSKEQEKDIRMDILFLVFEPRRGSKVRGLRSASVVAEQTSPGRFATSRALLKSLKMLINTALWVFFFFSKAVDSLCRLLKSTGNSIICLFLCQWIVDISKRSSEITVP